MPHFAERVAQCSTWKQLHHVALSADVANHPYERGVYFSNWRFCSAELLNQKIHAVRQGASIREVTRNYGLRAKVIELLAQQAK